MSRLISCVFFFCCCCCCLGLLNPPQHPIRFNSLKVFHHDCPNLRCGWPWPPAGVVAGGAKTFPSGIDEQWKKGTWLFRVYRGLFYPVMWGLSWSLQRSLFNNQYDGKYEGFSWLKWISHELFKPIAAPLVSQRCRSTPRDGGCFIFAGIDGNLFLLYRLGWIYIDVLTVIYIYRYINDGG